MKVALISYEPDNYDRDELDDLQVGDFDPATVHIYDLNKVDEQMIDYIVCNHLLSASVDGFIKLPILSLHSFCQVNKERQCN